MYNEILDCAARLGGIQTVTLINGYDKHKEPEKLTFRRFTIDNIKNLNSMHELWFESVTRGKALQLRRSSQLKTWKREPERFECSFKHGLYANVRWNTDEMLSNLLVQI